MKRRDTNERTSRCEHHDGLCSLCSDCETFGGVLKDAGFGVTLLMR
jgi:hypothetical protein